MDQVSSGLKLNRPVTVGEIIPVVSLVISFLAIMVSAWTAVYGWQRDREMRRHEYADRIRHSTGMVVAKLERWETLTRRFFDDIQPLLVDGSSTAVTQRDLVGAREHLYKGLMQAKAATSLRILDEQIELAYADLYGYDPKVRDLYRSAICQLRRRYDDGVQNVVAGTGDILRGDQNGRDAIDVVRRLRETCEGLDRRMGNEMDDVIRRFRDELGGLMGPDDDKIVDRSMSINSPAKVFRDAGDCDPGKILSGSGP